MHQFEHHFQKKNVSVYASLQDYKTNPELSLEEDKETF